MTGQLLIPIRFFHLHKMAEQRNHTRYAVCGICVSAINGEACAAATNGHLLGEVQWKTEDKADLTHTLVPLWVCKMCLRLARKDTDVTLTSKNGECTAEVLTSHGKVSIEFVSMDGAFPPYKDVIPKHDGKDAAYQIFLSPDRVSIIMSTMASVIGAKGFAVQLSLGKADKPVMFTAERYGVTVRSVLMPMLKSQ